MISKNSIYWDVTFFNTTNSLVASSLSTSQKLKEYSNLGTVNKALALENKTLREALTKKQELNVLPGTGYKPDSLQSGRFGFTVAKVIGGTVNLTNNYITIDKGTKDGLKPGMGVISPQGVVGQVMSCSDNFSRISSILHSEFSVSSEVLNKKLKANKITALGIGKWSGTNSKVIQLTTIDRFKSIFKGDSVVTSMQNSIFPPKIMVGRISKISTTTNEAFYNIDVRLSTDFSSLVYVYVVSNKLIDQQRKVEETPIQ